MSVRPPRIVSTRIRLLALFSFLCVLAVAVATVPRASNANRVTETTANKRTRPAFVPGEAIVRYKSETIARSKSSVAVNLDGRDLQIQIEEFDAAEIVPGLRLAKMPADDTLLAIEALNKQNDVLYAEPNYLLYEDLTPNDPRFLSNELYGLNLIGAPQAWNTTQGSSSIVVGVIDAGIDRVHQDLAANIWTNPGEIAGNGIDDDGNGFIDDVNGYNFIDNTGSIPADFHATHVAGTIGAVGNNSIGVVGVNWNVRLMSLKFVTGTIGSTADAIRACNYAKLMRDRWVSSGGTQGANVRVLNNSYGGGGFDQSFLDAIRSANQSGILFVAAAGNYPDDPEPNNDLVPHYPSGYDSPNVIGVAWTDAADNLSPSSHFGANTVHLGAPGDNILSTTPGNSYGQSSGTSMASPHVAGSAALLLAQNPNLTVQQLRSLVLFNGDLDPALNGFTLTGRRLDVGNSFVALSEGDVTPPGTVTNFHINSQTGRSFNIGWTASGDDGAAGQASLYQLSFTDAVSGTVINLKNLIPPSSGTAQSLNIKIPYRHTNGTLTLREFDNVGNEGTPATLPVTISLFDGDPYVTQLGTPAALSTGGSALSLIGDDKLYSSAHAGNGFSLPFAFPFFGQNYSSVDISTNGNLFFSAAPKRSGGDADDVPSSAVGVSQFKMISGLWDDLRTDGHAGDDVYVVVPDSTRIIFRWQGEIFGNGSNPASQPPVNFEVELRNDGRIITRYGSGNTSLFPVVGIGNGEPDAYVIPSHTSEQSPISLTNAQTVTFLPRTTSVLSIASLNPSSGVNITVTPADNGSQGNGTTPFTRTYDTGVSVNLTAPATAGGNNFLKWQKDGVDYAATAATSVTIDTAHTMTAVYATPRTLTVASSNPNSGVNITVSPADINSQGNGTTQFTRTYNDGTLVSLTAPATASGNNFSKWQKDGVDFAVTLATSVTMDAAHTMTAVYVTPRTLTVASSNPASGVNITVSPADNGSQGNGTTQFTRTYNDGTLVSLTAPATAGGNNFLKWQKDGADFAATLATSVTMDGAHTMTAVYVTPRTLTVASSNPGSGVSITVSPADNASQGNGTTQFTRTYNDGTLVSLTAPGTAGGNSFLKWQKDGVDFVGTAATSVTMDAAHTMTAVYVTPTATHGLTVGSVNPNSGVNITVSPADNGGSGSGLTQFTRTYNDGAVVNLTAPASANGNNFLKWQRDGLDWAVTPATNVTMNADHTMTAVFENVVQFGAAQYSVSESGLSVTVTVTRNGATPGSVSVDYVTSDGTARQKGDYLFASGRLTFAPGETSKSITLLIIDDVYQEGTEAFTLSLSNPSGASLGPQSSTTVNILDNDTVPPTSNPLNNSDARFFVRQHYIDFLNREPDQSGLDFWSHQISDCLSPSCIDIKKVNVSGAFFLSIEFQQTGYLAERMYRVAYGEATGTSTFNGFHTLPVPIIRFNEFLVDSQQIGRGVVIGEPGADQLLESNKVAFANDFVSRSRFTTAFPAGMSAATFVNILNTNSGNALDSGQVSSFVNQLNAGTMTRAQVLRAVAEDQDLDNAEKLKAFVLMQYFGYLRRDPNSGPDTDHSGYDFWLTKLLQFNGNFVAAEMVKAFIVSSEYRERFGPG